MYYDITVKFKTEDDKGKQKETSLVFLVEDETTISAETQLTEHLIKEGEADFRIAKTQESKIYKVL
jgi:hypothetical protein